MTQGITEARSARRESTEALMYVIGQGPQVRALADRLGEHARRNHFQDLFDDTRGRSRGRWS